MKKIVTLFLLLLNAINLSAQQKIIGGNVVDIMNRPFQTAIFINGAFNGGGVILNSQWILTAAHVVKNENSTYSPSLITVSTAHSNLNEDTNRSSVIQVIPHPNYLFGVWGEYDLALLKLSQPLILNKLDCTPINVSNITTYIPGANAVVSGWGRRSVNGEPSLSQLYSTSVTIQSCTNTQIKTTISNTVAYKGDSGGPLTIGDDLIGIVSWIESVTNPTKSSSYYVNTGYYYNWIKSYAGIISGPMSVFTPSIVTNQGSCNVVNIPSDCSLSWELSNTSIASINNQGVITTKGQGTTDVITTITAPNGYKEIMKSRTIIGIPKMYITRYDAVEYPPLNALSLVTNREYLFMANSTSDYWDISNIGFNFHWSLRNSSGTLVDSRSVYNCGVRVGIFGTTFPSAGTYTLEVEIEKDGVSETYRRTVEAIGGYRATPNPANSQLTIQSVDRKMGYALLSADPEQATARLYSSSSLVRSVSFNSKEGVTIDVSSLPDGVYYLVIQNQNGDKVLDRQTVIVKH